VAVGETKITKKKIVYRQLSIPAIIFELAARASLLANQCNNEKSKLIASHLQSISRA